MLSLSCPKCPLVLAALQLRVIGKGQREREVPVPLEVVTELAKYLASRGLDKDPENLGNQGAHLLGQASDLDERAARLNRAGKIGRAGRGALAGETGLGDEAPPFDPRRGVAASTLYNQIKAFFGDCADVLRGQGDAKGASRLASASTHWMRHSHASHAIAAGMPIEIAQQNLGHASLATTTVYVTTEAKRRMKAVSAFWAGKR